MNDRRWFAGSPVFPARGRRASLFWATSICLLLCACSSSARDTVATAGAQRIVSLVPSATEAIVLLGGADRLVGRTDYDEDARIAGVFSFGRSMRSSVEAVLARDPDLLIDASYAHSSAHAELLARSGVHTLTTDLQTLADVVALIDTLGALLHLRARADSLHNDLQRRANALRASAAANPPAMLYVVWPDPPRTISRAGYLAEIIQLAGGRVAFDDVKASWPELTIESIVQRDPDYLIVPVEPGNSADRLRELPGWRELTAVRKGRIIEVPLALFNRPGPRVIDAAEWLRARLQLQLARLQ